VEQHFEQQNMEVLTGKMKLTRYATQTFKSQVDLALIDSRSQHMIRKGQLDCPASLTMSVADQFYSLAV